MTRAVIRIHTYAALLTIVNLMVYATTGAYGVLHGKRSAEPAIRYLEYHAAEGETARQTARRVVALLGLTLATPIQSAAIQHTTSGELLLDFYHANGRHRVTVLPERNQLRIEITRNSPARYADILHETTGVFRSGDWRMQFWAYENEFALWCFFAMLASALWMAMARFRSLAATRLRIVHLASSAIFFPFAVILGASALQMAHRTWFAPIAWAARLHRSSAIVAAACAVLIPVLAGSGIWLWYRTRPARAAVAVLATGALTLSLIVWMRM